ncbi:BZ3500_MvSof-1268-A1-R1_Chr1-3g02103 [Microbotryum saponariae]|uniref:BZ3500_MvSof-1268-A1-R1_Chr1-3g02103 protein n=1 Tax=Microbotryum saponariae TaxID=289078 RepID=A0A2X0KDV8_9BASI|nr:BZ3500_MvSof-1268-A1-R1_Chr1-3g02103 [Microbotryum saponariae]SCZ95405.1 BZ3501_MvSof-1269-A2-R1_Chr1-3g01705 [Microbotryum saponariae]
MAVWSLPPTVPEGISPYVVYLQAVTEQLYNPPTPAFETRLFVLVGCMTLCALITTVYMFFVCEQALQRNGGPGVWLCKRVAIGRSAANEPNGLVTADASGSAEASRIIVINTKLAISLGMIVQELYCIAYLLQVKTVYAYHGDQSHIYALRAFLPFPICFVAWGVSCGVLQAYTLVHANQRGQKIWGPRINHLFVYGGLVWLIAYLAGGITATFAGCGWWHVWLDFSADLRQLQANYTGSLTGEEWLALNDGFAKYIRKRNAYALSSQILFGSLPLFVAVVVVINTSTFLLTQMINERLGHQLEHFTKVSTRPTWESQDIVLSPLDRCATQQTYRVDGSRTSSVLRDNAVTVSPSFHLERGTDRKNSPGASSYLTLDNGLPRKPKASTWRNQFAEPGVRLEHVRALAGSRQLDSDSPSSTPKEARRLKAIQMLELDATRAFLALVGGAIAVCAFFSIAIALAAAIAFSGPFFTNWTHFLYLSFPWSIVALVLGTGPPLVYLQLRARSLWIARKKSSLVICRNVHVVVET